MPPPNRRTRSGRARVGYARPGLMFAGSRPIYIGREYAHARRGPQTSGGSIGCGDCGGSVLSRMSSMPCNKLSAVPVVQVMLATR